MASRSSGGLPMSIGWPQEISACCWKDTRFVLALLHSGLLSKLSKMPLTLVCEKLGFGLSGVDLH